MLPSLRREVLWVSDSDPVIPPFKERRLLLKRIRFDEKVEIRDSTRALILVVPRARIEQLRILATENAKPALDRGIMLFALLEADADFVPVQDLLKSLSYGTRIRVEFRDNLADVAESIARADNEIGPSCGNVELPPSLPDVSATTRLLLTRAFHDCTTIQVKPIGGGFAAECTLQVHAWLAASQVGPRPMPFFVKAGNPSEIAKERYNYEQVAGHYIPFNLRPNLIPDRCVVGSDRALIVGNFVEDAIPLREALQSGQASTAIFSLFENTLRGFRMQPFTEHNAPSWDLAPFVNDRSWAKNIRSDVVDLAVSYDLHRNASEIQEGLVEVAKSLKCRMGPYHGDLHAGNVMVRHRDSIVIDFGSINFGPLTADPAALEASLVFGDLPPGEDFESWRHFVDHLYGSLSSLSPPVPEAIPTRFSWLYRSVRELRHILVGFEGIEKEAKTVLAAYLIRFSRLLQTPLSLPPTFSEKRHAYALVIAERLLEALQHP